MKELKDFDYWMLTEMNEILNKEYRVVLKKADIANHYKKFAKKKEMEKQKEYYPSLRIIVLNRWGK